MLVILEGLVLAFWLLLVCVVCVAIGPAGLFGGFFNPSQVPDPLMFNGNESYHKYVHIVSSLISQSVHRFFTMREYAFIQEGE